MKGALAVVLVLVGILAAAVGLSLWAWRELGEVDIGFHGYVALLLGVGATLAVGAGLIALMLYSSRRGYDEEAYRHQEGHTFRDRRDDRD